MNDARDSFLIQAIGECKTCADTCPYSCIDFSTWRGFGVLFEEAQKQPWWEYFNNCLYYHEYAKIHPIDHPDVINDCDYMLSHRYINPDNFADALYEFLKEKL